MKISTKTLNYIIALFGIITVSFFILLGIYGGYYHSLDSFLFREVSYAISPYTPYRAVTVPLYKQYNLYLILFAILLCFRIRNSYAKLGALYLSFAGITGFTLLRFPMDANGSGATVEGIEHNVYAITLSLYVALALLLFVWAFRKVKKLYWLSVLSLIESIIFLGASLLTGVLAFMSKPVYVGLVERLAIGTYLLWIVLVAIGMITLSKKRIRSS